MKEKCSEVLTKIQEADSLVIGASNGLSISEGISSTLKEMQTDGLIHREEYPQIPPKVEYSLTEKGKTLWPIIQKMCQWGELNR